MRHMFLTFQNGICINLVKPTCPIKVDICLSIKQGKWKGPNCDICMATEKRKPSFGQLTCQFWVKNSQQSAWKGCIRFSLLFSNSTQIVHCQDVKLMAHLKSEQKCAMLGTSGQACKSLSVDILAPPPQPLRTNPKSPNRIPSTHTHSRLRWCLFGLHLWLQFTILVFTSYGWMIHISAPSCLPVRAEHFPEAFSPVILSEYLVTEICWPESFLFIPIL